MGEAKRRLKSGLSPERQNPNLRSWAIGEIRVNANDVPCFKWAGTRTMGVELQQEYLDIVNVFVNGAESYARRAAGYLMCYGMPQPGGADLRAANHGQRWEQVEIDLYKRAVLWSALHQSVPRTKRKVEDEFVGKELEVVFRGDKKLIEDYTARELAGAVLDNSNQFSMEVSVISEHVRLDPSKATAMQSRDLYGLAGIDLSDNDRLANKPTYVPRIPADEAEAKAMLNMITVFTDLSSASLGIRTYAGYTEDELRGGKTAVVVR